MSSVIVAHPGQQHSYRLASALKHADLLDEYITTVYYRNSRSLLGVLAAIAPGDNGSRIRSRHNPDLDNTIVRQFCAVRGFVETLMWRTNCPQKYRSYMEKTKRLFGYKVAREAAARNVDAVVCYDVNALDCFSTLKKERPDILRILDVSIAPRPYLRKIYEEVSGLTGRKNLREENPLVWDQHEDEERINEIALADFYLAPSDFVADGLTSLGADPDSILKLPYGCNFIQKAKTRVESTNSATFELLFVGQCNARKGADVLAELMEAPCMEDVRLTVAGKFDSSRPYIQKMLNNPRVRMLGMVARQEVEQLCAESDAFVFPSVAEGMSLACIEAMGSGLPIICTPNSGVSDLVIDGETGFLVRPGDFDELCASVLKLKRDSEMRVRMSRGAQEVSASYSWENYEKRAAELFALMLEKKSLREK